MNKKINQYAKGKFEYTQSKIQCDRQMLQLETQAGENISGSFKIWVEDAKEVRGMVVTDCHYMTLEEDVFQGKEEEKVIFTLYQIMDV